MASNEQTAGSNAEWTTGDSLNETNLRTRGARANATDYVERGLTFSADWTNDELTIGATGGTEPNYAIVLDGHERYDLYPTQETVSLPNGSGTNYVFVAYNTSTDEVYYHVDDDDTAPSDPSLKIGTADTSAETTTTLNRNPSISADEQNNTYYIRPTDDPQTVADALKSDHGQGKLVFLPGTHTFTGLTIDFTCVITGYGGPEANKTVLEPDSDADLLILDDDNGSPIVRDLRFNGGAVTNYSSSLCVVRGTHSQQTVLERCGFSAAAGSGGVAVEYRNDTSNTMSWVKARDLNINDCDIALDMRSTGGGNINANVFENIHLKANRICVSEDTGVNRNHYGLIIQFSSAGTATEEVIDAGTTGASLELLTYDVANASPSVNNGLISGGKNVDKNDPLRVEIIGGSLAEYCVPAVVKDFYLNKADRYVYEGGAGLPSWMTDTGTGSTTFPSFNRTKLETGSTSGDSRELVASQNRNLGSEAAYCSWFADVPGGSNVLWKYGIRSESGHEVTGVYDPEDTLGTGITSNWIARIVDSDGTELAAVDTGIAINDETITTGIFRNGDYAYVATGSNGVETSVQFSASRSFGVEPWLYLETKTSAAKSTQAGYVDLLAVE